MRGSSVVSPGISLTVDDQVIVAGASALTDGATVRVLEQREAGDPSDDGESETETQPASSGD